VFLCSIRTPDEFLSFEGTMVPEPMIVTFINNT